MRKIYKRFKKSLVLQALSILFFSININAQITIQTFSFTGGLQTFTVPACVSIMTIEARGAQGGTSQNANYPGGLGATMVGTFSVTTGAVLNVIVGGKGNDNIYTSGGGGGSGVGISNTPLIVAGGGGGVDQGNPTYAGRHGVITTGGIAGGGTGGAGGVGGADGGSHTWVSLGNNIAYGGRGWNTNNAGSFGQNGISPNTTTTSGTWGIGGGGGSVGSGYCNCGGGGGGYSGGGAAYINNSGGGGGSYNAGTNQVNTAGANSGHGLVILTYNFNGNGVAASITPSVICTGSNATLTASGMLSYTWSTGSNASSIIETPTVSGSYTVQGTNSVNCVSSSILSITVSNGLPVLSVTSSTNQTCLGKSVTLTATGALTYTWTGGPVNGVSFTPTATNSYTVTGQNGCGTSTAVTSVTVAPLPVSAISSPTIVCAGRPTTLTAISAANGYTWQPFGLIGSTVAVSPTVTTNYTVTVSDGTCSGITNVLVSALPVPTINIVASTSIVCLGDPVFLTASGGINYTWTPGNLSGNSVTVNPTVPTLYQVTGDNSVGCTTSTTQIVLTNSSPTVNITASTAFVCAGDLVNLVASGANTYTWSNGPGTSAYAINPTVTTIYSVTGYSTNNPCGATKTISIVVFKPEFTVTPSAATLCSGSGLTLTASGADNYLWDIGTIGPEINVSPTTNTMYVVTASSASNGISCLSSKTVQVVVYPSPTVTATSPRTIICKGEKAVLTAGGAVSYSWSSGSSSAAVTVSPNVPNTYIYTVTGTDANGCKNTANISVKVNSCTGLNESTGVTGQLSVYPNPNNGEFVVEYDMEVNLSITNGLGQEIRTLRLSDLNNFKATVRELAAGIYFISGQSGANVFNQKIVINE